MENADEAIACIPGIREDLTILKKAAENADESRRDFKKIGYIILTALIGLMFSTFAVIAVTVFSNHPRP